MLCLLIPYINVLSRPLHELLEVVSNGRSDIGDMKTESDLDFGCPHVMNDSSQLIATHLSSPITEIWKRSSVVVAPQSLDAEKRSLKLTFY